ncbi:hypothetical protein [Cellvibrio mixtus]|uniref:hypothetical protein n=1 Tax=Cellvibrio mixtus TaxID=39650 RepID=UPI0005878AE7|nr:hypothetical protein [Cellvibrio mixtus]
MVYLISSATYIKHSDSNDRVTRYVGDFALYIQTGGATPTSKHEYVHRDHIGSIVVISKSTVSAATDISWQANGA